MFIYWDKMAWFIALVGSAIFLIASWYFSIGPVLDRWLVPYCLIGGPVVSIGLGLALIGVRNGLRSLIQPARHFARTGQLPPGTPPALVLNETTGEFQLADPTAARVSQESDWVEFWIGRDSLPPICCVCLGSSTPGSEMACTVTQALGPANTPLQGMQAQCRMGERKGWSCLVCRWPTGAGNGDGGNSLKWV